MTNAEVGARIWQLRQRNHYTREAFAEKVGVSSKFLYEIENGKKGFSAETLFRIANTLSVSCDYILTGQDNHRISSEEIMLMLEKFDDTQMEKIYEILNCMYDLCKKAH